MHHAVALVCEPVLERLLIADTFACRRGKGREAAVERAKQFATRYPWFLKLDIRKYFNSVDHERLIALLGRRFKDRRLLDLFDRIIASYEVTPGTGVPIGSLTSQYFANLRWTAKASNRVIRGGSWNNDPRNCRPANRNRNEPDNRNNNLGFRLAAALPARWIPRRTGPAVLLSRSRHFRPGERRLGPRRAGSDREGSVRSYLLVSGKRHAVRTRTEKAARYGAGGKSRRRGLHRERRGTYAGAMSSWHPPFTFEQCYRSSETGGVTEIGRSSKRRNEIGVECCRFRCRKITGI